MSGNIFILLGSNLGDPVRQISAARTHIGRLIGPIVTSSSLYLTAAWGKTNQPDFINQVIKIESELNADQILNRCLEIEAMLGRIRNEKWAPRIIDIDLLFYGEAVLKSSFLTVPHPEIQKRKFTLVPLCEISPEFIHPVLKKSMKTLLGACEDLSRVEKMESRD